MADEPVEVEVFYDDKQELDQAKAVLTAVRPDIRIYKGVIEGWADADAVQKLVDARLVVAPLAAPKPEADELVAGLTAMPAPPSPEDDAMLELRRHLKYVARTDQGLELLDHEVSDAQLDARIHDVGPRKIQPEPEEAPDDAVYHINLRGPITEEQGRQFQDLGISLAAFEPPSLYRTFLTGEQFATVVALDFVESVERTRLEETVTKEVLESISGATAPGEDAGPTLLGMDAEAAPKRETYDCVLHRIADREMVAGLIESLDGVDVTESSYLYIRFEAPADPRIVASVAKLPQVRRLGLYTPPTLMSDRARVLTGVEGAATVAPGGLTGEGEVVFVFDSGVDKTHPDLTDRVETSEAYKTGTADDKQGHGTHVCGIIAGTGAASGEKIRGIAPGAKLHVVGVVEMQGQSASVIAPADWGPLLEKAVEKGAKIVNLSLGMSVGGEYDFGSMSVDQFVCDHPDVLVVVAAGNEGKAPKGYALIKNVFSPASAKNVLTVGASSSDRVLDPPMMWGQRFPDRFGAAPSSEELLCGDPDTPAAISSRGPTEFDSVKPDLLAPGTQILAPKASGGTGKYWPPPYEEHGGRYGYLSGTSMAAPVVSGAAALVRQYLRFQAQNTTPSAALMKAILVAAARKVKPRPGPEGFPERVGFPDFDQGFGRLDLATVFPGAEGASPRRKLLCADYLNSSDEALISRPQEKPEKKFAKSRTHCFTVSPNATEPLQVVLTWTDWPSSYVQNNLHLEVAGPEETVPGNPGHVYLQQKDPLIEGLTDPGKKTKLPFVDKANNVEKVTIESPKEGEYCVTILAQSTPFPQQGYALCIVGEIEGELRTVE